MKNQNQHNPEITIAEARKALGMIHRNYSDVQIEQIIDIMWDAAEFAYDKYSSDGGGE